MGYASCCKSVDIGSIPVRASISGSSISDRLYDATRNIWTRLGDHVQTIPPRAVHSSNPSICVL